MLVGAAAVVCLVGSAAALGVHSTASRSRPPTPDAATGQLKPAIRGLITDVSSLATDSVNLSRSFLVSVNWAQLQRTPNGPIVRDNAIDRAIEAIRSFNGGSNEPPLQLKLRVNSGVGAPDWAKNLQGAPIPVTETFSSISGTIGRFWIDEFGDAYRDLQQKLATLYDAVPEVAEVVISRCTTIFAEPFVRHVTNQEAVRSMLAAGYTADADERCQRAQIDAHTVWKETRSGLALNPYQRVRAGNDIKIDQQFTERMMEYCRRQLGRRCVLENNSIRWPPLGGSYASMYGKMRSLGPPTSFQTAAPSRIGDPVQTLRWAIRQGANAVEFLVGARDIAPETWVELDRQLRANPS